MSAGPSLEDVRAAHARIASYIHLTPVLTCKALDAISGAQLFFKCENLQKTGSFKIRGATNAILQLTDLAAAMGVVTHSSGNHAAAVACAARQRGVPAWIVMPENAPATKRAAVEEYGGYVTLCPPTLEARESTANKLMAGSGATMIHPYNDDRIIAGQATAALELLEAVPDLDMVIAPVSGGGLLSGASISAKSLRPEIRVIGAEPKNADDAFRSLASGNLEPPGRGNTMADGLRATLCERTLAIIRERVDEIVLVTEEEILQAMRAVWERMKIIIEPSSAVAVAPLLLHRVHAEGKRVGVILSGGNLDLEQMSFAPSAVK